MRGDWQGFGNWQLDELREAVREAARRGEVFESDHVYDAETGKQIFGEDETAALVREAVREAKP